MGSVDSRPEALDSVRGCESSVPGYSGIVRRVVRGSYGAHRNASTRSQRSQWRIVDSTTFENTQSTAAFSAWVTLAVKDTATPSVERWQKASRCRRGQQRDESRHDDFDMGPGWEKF